MAILLHNLGMSHGPQNHTVPILETLELPDDTAHVLIVMPYLRIFDNPPFHCLQEAVDALHQFLEVSNSLL
jgi:hypothetical protein